MPIKVKSLDVLDDPAQDLLRRAEIAAGNGDPNRRSERAGAAALAPDGSTYPGSRFGPQGQDVTICAEIGAVSAAYAAGRELVALALVAGTDAERADPEAPPATPCGSCRAVLAAFSAAQQREIVIYLANRGLTRIVLTTSGELLP